MATASELRERAENLRRTARTGEILSSDRQLVSRCLEKEAADLMWAASTRDHIESTGRSFFDYKYSWLPDRERAIESYRMTCERRRRQEGSREIIRKLSEVEGKERPGSYKVTKARGKVLKAIVSITSKSGRLYCSYQTLGKAAGVSARTAHTVRSELEDLGVLERVRTGGKAADGTCHSNKYTVKWNTLRQVLGIRNRWESRYPTDSKGIVRALNTSQVKKFYTWTPKPVLAAVENLPINSSEKMAANKNSASEQALCTLTELINQNNPNNTQPARSLCSKQSIQRDKQDSENKASALVKNFNQSLRRRLSRMSTVKLTAVLAELEAHLRWTPAYAPLPVMAEDYLTPILDIEGL